MSDHTYWEELAAGYALDALDDDDRVEFEEHLDGCDVCPALVDQHALVAAQLGSLAGDDAAAAPSWSAVRTGVVGPAEGEPAGDVIDLGNRRRLAWLGAAAAVVAIAVGVTTWQVNRSSGPAESLASVDACERTPTCHVVSLRTDKGSPASVLVDGGRYALVSTSMPAPAAGHVWALWQLPHAGDPLLLSEFTHDVSPKQLEAPYDDTAAFAVSSELASATPAAPAEVVATGSVT